MKFLIHIFSIIGLLTTGFSQPFSSPEEIANYARGLAPGAVSALSTANAKAGAALARNSLNSGHLKGEFGEMVAEEFYLNRHLANQQTWRSLTPRFGRQGLDQLFIKYDGQGRPAGILVGEVKYGSSQLDMTYDGLQMSDSWTSRRLAALQGRYQNAIDSDVLVNQRRPTGLASPRHQIPVVLTDGRDVVFWREDARASWKFDGPEESLAQAKDRLQQTSNYIGAAAEGRIDIRKRLIQVNFEDELLRIRISNLNSGGAAIAGAPIDEINVSLKGQEGAYLRNTAKVEISKQISRSYPYWSMRDIEEMADGIVEKTNRDLQQSLEPSDSPQRLMARNALKVGVIGSVAMVLIDPLVHEMSLSRSMKIGGLGFGSAFAGALTGQSVESALLQKRWVYNLTKHAAARVGLSNSAARSIASMGGAAVVATIVFSYGEWALGEVDLDAANRNAAAGLIGSGAGALAYGGIVALPGLLGATASTGAAISGLSGVAATNASLAALGGGSVAAGGGGMAMGSIVATGGAAIVAVAVVGGVYYGYHLHDEAQENKRVELMICALKDPSFIDRLYLNPSTLKP